MTAFSKKELYRPDEVAVYFSVSRKTIYRRIDKGIIKAKKMGSLLRIPRSELKKVLRPVE